MTDTPGSTHIDQWRLELTELGGPNNLLWFDERSRGVLDLTSAHPAGVARLFSTDQVRLSQVFREAYAYAEATRRVRQIRAKAIELEEDWGLDSCWLGVGLAAWDTRTNRRLVAPVVLRRVRLRPVAGHPDDLTIEVDGRPIINPALVTYLHQAHGVELDVEALTALAGVASASDPRQVFEEITRACGVDPELTIERRQIMSTFNVTKTDLVADLMNPDVLESHPLIAALGGDPEAIDQVRAVPPEVDPTGLTDRPTVLATDAAGQQVIQAVTAGAHLTVSGGPGTGKSQTLANLVAELAGQGRPMLLVSRKQASIDAVATRLESIGLGDLIVSVQDGRTGPEFEDFFNRRIQQAIAAGDKEVAAQPDPPREAVELQRHYESMHAVHQPWGVSLTQVLTQVTELGARRPAPRSHARLSSDDLLAFSPKRRDEATRKLLTVARKGAWPTSGENDPWYGATVVGPQQAQRALDSVTSLADGRLAQHRETIARLFDDVGLPAPADLREEERCLELMQQVESTLEVFRPEVFRAPLADMAAATGGRAARREGEHLSLLARRRLSKQAHDLLRPGPRPDLSGVLLRAERQRRQWREVAGKGSSPSTTKGLGAAVQAHEKLREELEWLGARLETTLDGGDLLDQSFDALQARLTRLGRAADRLAVVPEVAADLDTLRAQGLGALVDDLAARQVPVDQVPIELEFVWWTSLFAHLSSTGATRSIDGTEVRRLLDQYAQADEHHRAAEAERVRDQVDARLRYVVRNLPEQVRAVQQGLAKGATLRDLLPVAPELLMALMPCWAMSPLLVAGHVPPGVWFDVVAIDQAAQLPVAQAVSAISRGSQTVAVGDPRSVWPRSFAMDPAVTMHPDGLQSSIFDELRALVPGVELTTHYRSMDARLFEFANVQGYDGRIRTFPSTAVERPMRLDVVRTHAQEIERVVELVIQHVRRDPQQSLMVVTLTDEHADRVAGALQREAVKDPALAEALVRDTEPVLVRSAHRAQGCARDIVVLTTECRVNDHGALVGAGARALDADGDRALIVATTRARLSLIVVSAVSHADIAVGALRGAGPVMYRDLLIYAASGGAGRGETSTPPAATKVRRGRRAASTGSVLEQQAAPSPMRAPSQPVIAELVGRLRDEGVKIRSEAMPGRPALDFVVDDPDRRGAPLIGIDTDGVAVADLMHVRDRDLVRPQQLRLRGWDYERVLLQEIFRDPAQQVAWLTERIGGPTGAVGDE